MTYNNVLPFDDESAWKNLIEHIEKLNQAEKVVYFGLKDKKITIRCIYKGYYLITSYSLASLRFNAYEESKLKLVEDSMSRPVITKHLHSYEKSSTHNSDWRKQVYRCKDPQCTHYQTAQFIEGKEVSCFKCHLPTIVEKKTLWKSRRHIVCLLCSKSPEKFKVVAGKNVMEELLGEILEKIELEEIVDDPILKMLREEGIE